MVALTHCRDLTLPTTFRPFINHILHQRRMFAQCGVFALHISLVCRAKVNVNVNGSPKNQMLSCHCQCHRRRTRHRDPDRDRNRNKTESAHNIHGSPGCEAPCENLINPLKRRPIGKRVQAYRIIAWASVRFFLCAFSRTCSGDFFPCLM